MTTLTSTFQGREAYAPSTSYRLAPFRFGPLDERRYILTNDVGEYVVTSRAELEAFARRRLPIGTPLYKDLKARHFLFDKDSECALDLLSLKYRTRAETIARFTGLHIFVVTLRCDHSCHYCQVSRQTEDKAAFDMRREDADEALALTFRSPASHLKIEFQGGEPLLAFDLIRYIVERAEELARVHGKVVQFVIASNLSRLTDEILAFVRKHQIYFSTSLDGPEDLHNAHRPLKNGNSYATTIAGIRRIREALGDNAVSALMTTTPASLERVEDIVDEYVRQGFSSIFLRHLSPFGFAVRSSLVRKYDAKAWLEFWKRGLAHVLARNREGVHLREDYTSIILGKIFAPHGSTYVDLQSPAGIGIGALVYNYDGAVYASDEGRMLAEMGDMSFRLGQLGKDSYEELMTHEALLDPLAASLLESSPMCTDCPFLPYCGADPVFHRATQRDAVGHKVFSAFCQRQMGVVRHIISLLEDDAEARRILLGWV
jgi:uncharacterized protein